MFKDREIKLDINWKDLIVKVLLLILLIILLVWLIPKPQQIDTFYDRVFNENIQTMKEAAKSYYTTDKLPTNIGDVSTMTLEDMIKNHMVLEFVDKDNKTCDSKNSFVQVTKTGENEYILKVQLKCGDQTDYIIETIGCHDVCPSGDCDKKDDTKYVSVTQYQFKKDVPTTSTVYTCPSGYTLNGTLCYKSGAAETINATPTYFDDTILAVNAKVNTTGSYIVYADPIKKDTVSCPSGYIYNGVQCAKTYKASSTTTSGTYTCPSGYTLSGATCYKTYAATYNNGSVVYSCPAGYSLKDTACYKTIDATYVSGGTNYTCPSGYTLNGTKCTKTVAASTSSTNTTYSCNSGDRLDGTTCYKTTTTDATATTTYGDWKVAQTYSTTSTKQTYTNETEKLVYDGMTYKYTCNVVSQCPVKAAHYNYTLYKRTKTTTYTCSTGTKEGTKCVSTSTYAAKATTTGGGKYCSSGTLNGDNCIITIDATKSTTNGYYTCPSGYSLSGKSCVAVTASTKHTENGKYVCTEGGILSGTLCRTSVSATTTGGTVTLACPYGGTLAGTNCTTYTNGSSNTTYSCPSGYTANGSGASTTCSKSVTGNNTYYCENKSAELKGTKCYYKVKGSISGYTCPTGYTKNGSVCTKSKVTTVKATATTKTTTSTKYTWSENKTLAGWTATGKTQVVKKAVKA